MNTEANDDQYVKLPVAARDFILQAMREASQALSKTHRLRATSHILVEEGIKLTRANSFQIDNVDPVLLMNLAKRLLAREGPGVSR
jgi:hypothetical protein